MLTSQLIKEKARQFGADLCGIGDISLFEGCDPQRDPRKICPKATAVIGFAFRVPKGLYAGMENADQFLNYTQLGVKYIDEQLAEMFLLRMASVIENEGYDACVQRNVSNLKIKGDKTQNPEVVDTYELIHASPVAPGLPTPDIILDFGQAAKICGIGTPGRSGSVLTRGFGPFVRLAFIVTDAPLEPDAPFEEDFCAGCMECAAACPGHCIDAEGRDSWSCSVYYRGAHESNPYMTKDFLRDHPQREAIIKGEMRFDAASARAIYPALDFLPSKRTGYAPCICGKKCDIACYKHIMGVKEL